MPKVDICVCDQEMCSKIPTNEMLNTIARFEICWK